MSLRIYRVAHTETGLEHLIEAHTPAQALRHVTRAQFVVEVASQRDVARLVHGGMHIELAGSPTESDEDELPDDDAQAKSRGGK